MAKVKYSARALRDLDCADAFLAEVQPDSTQETHRAIAEAISVLERHPFIGREVERGLRELVISRGKSGYLALYRFHEEEDIVVIYAIRHQRELDWID